MITEHALLPVKPGLEAAFEEAFASARHIIAAAPGFQGLTLSRDPFPVVEHYRQVDSA